MYLFSPITCSSVFCSRAARASSRFWNAGSIAKASAIELQAAVEAVGRAIKEEGSAREGYPEFLANSRERQFHQVPARAPSIALRLGSRQMRAVRQALRRAGSNPRGYRR
jgi:hypothetical protein